MAAASGVNIGVSADDLRVLVTEKVLECGPERRGRRFRSLIFALACCPSGA
jgi:hypothetical protein